jgi:hypothetical protein
MPMVIAMLMNIEDVMTNIVVLGISQRQRFLTKSNRIMLGIENRTHTVCKLFLPSNDRQYYAGTFVSSASLKSHLSFCLGQQKFLV